jgi:hypothetical protein
MHTNSYIRHKLINLVQDTPVARRKLISQFSSSTRKRAEAQLGQLLCDGVFVTTGIGHRGYPKMIERGPLFPKSRCPMCLRELV